MSRVDDALACFKEGFSCSQAVFASYAKDFGMDYVKNACLILNDLLDLHD